MPISVLMTANPSVPASMQARAFARMSVWFGDNRVAFEGERDPAYSEAGTSAYMKGDHIVIRADIGLGRGKATVYTCDLTKEYVAINGDYRS